MLTSRFNFAGAIGAMAITFATASLALPAGGPVNAPLPEGAPVIEKVERICRQDGYCFNKYTGAPMGYVQLPRRVQPRYYEEPRYYQPQPRVYVEPRYEERRYVRPRPYYY